MASRCGSSKSSQKFPVSQGVSSSSELGDLPSKRLLGKGLSSIGYETEVNGKRFARQDFIGVPSNTFMREASVLVGLKPHDNVVRTIGWTVDNRSCSLVSDYMEDNLLVLLLKRKQLDKDHPPSQSQSFDMLEKLDIMWQIASGMEYLHQHGVSHGDLKCKNILVSRSHNDKKPLTVKVGDYGRVRTKRKSMAFACRQARERDMVRWKAPELLEGLLRQDSDGTSSESDTETSESASTYSNIPSRTLMDDWSEMYWRAGAHVASSSSIHYRECSADVYSFAVLCSQILSDGEDPYPDFRKWPAVPMANEIRPTLPDACPPELIILLNFCWGPTPSLRPQFWHIRRALERLLPYPLGPIPASLYIDHLKQYTPAARFAIVTELIHHLVSDDPFRREGKLGTISVKPEVIRPYVVKIIVKMSVLCRKKIFEQNTLKGMMELYTLRLVADTLIRLLSSNYLGDSSCLWESSKKLSVIIYEFETMISSATRRNWYDQLQNKLSRKPSLVTEDVLEMFNLTTKFGEVLLGVSSKEFWKLLEEIGRKYPLTKLRMPNLTSIEADLITDFLIGRGTLATFDESTKVLTVGTFALSSRSREHYWHYVCGVVRRRSFQMFGVADELHEGDFEMLEGDFELDPKFGLYRTRRLQPEICDEKHQSSEEEKKKDGDLRWTGQHPFIQLRKYLRNKCCAGTSSGSYSG